ncbi:hypothetical protein [Methanosarcina siciliae]|nr:hypothetical protein [Methanosarcina siciliae]
MEKPSQIPEESMGCRKCGRKPATFIVTFSLEMEGTGRNPVHLETEAL